MAFERSAGAFHTPHDAAIVGTIAKCTIMPIRCTFEPLSVQPSTVTTDWLPLLQPFTAGDFATTRPESSFGRSPQPEEDSRRGQRRRSTTVIYNVFFHRCVAPKWPKWACVWLDVHIVATTAYGQRRGRKRFAARKADGAAWRCNEWIARVLVHDRIYDRTLIQEAVLYTVESQQRRARTPNMIFIILNDKRRSSTVSHHLDCL